MEFLDDYMVVGVIAVCMAIGYIIKHAVPGDKINRFIPLIMGVIGVLMNVWMSGRISPAIVTAGLVSGLASTGLHQAFKQFIEKN